MAHATLFDRTNSLIVVRFWDHVDVVELDLLRQEIEASPMLRPGLDRLWDQRNCVIDVTTEELRELAERWSESDDLHGERRVAYLVSGDLGWGFNRQFESWRDVHQPHVGPGLFRDYDALKEWLDLPPDFPDPTVLVPRPGE